MSSSGDLRPPPDRFFGPLDQATKRPRFQSNSNIIQSVNTREDDILEVRDALRAEKEIPGTV